MARLEARDVLCAPVNRYADLPSDPQVIASGMLVEEEHPRAGRLRTLNTAIRFDRTPGGIRTPAPALGEHTDVVLAEAGLEPEEVARLRSNRVIF
jgi:crotonobetainyl-CoA:carnitine CoA-transferase CaiB-like acyl-CoA transferase